MTVHPTGQQNQPLPGQGGEEHRDEEPHHASNGCGGPNGNPLISIITINRNNASGLRRTLAMTAKQTCRSYEQIVVDGASTDDSVEVIRDARLKDDRWISEPDSGVYNAMNKGISMARGTYLLFLNSGDHFRDEGSLELAAEHLGSSDLHYFGLEVRDRPQPDTTWSKQRRYPDRLPFSFFLSGALPHPATFIRALLFQRLGLYDESLRIVADWKYFMVAVCRHHCSYRAHHHPLTVFYADGLSSDPSAGLHRRERDAVLAAEFPAFVDDARILVDAPTAVLTVQALRRSRWIRLLQSMGLLWNF